MTQQLYQTDQNEPQNLYRTFLVGIYTSEENLEEINESLRELAELVKVLNIPIAGETLSHVRETNPKFYIGSGKAEELRLKAMELNANVIIFDVQLSPSQQRNLEHLLQVKVIDRQEVILDIFATRAKTKEAILQVELARLEYFFSRLTGAWTHFSRQHGGVTGARGEGEKQIEIDRRQLRQKIVSLKRELETVRKHRKTQRKQRERTSIPNAAITGYTNAGKSTLLNCLTGAKSFTANQLFATLDPTTKKLELPDKSSLILTDTVGFIQRLPHSLVEAFHSTLEEVIFSDFIIIVLDASSPSVFVHFNTTLSVLHELGADDKSILVVCNKIDKISNPLIRIKLKSAFPDSVFTSCETGEGIEELKSVLLRFCGKRARLRKIQIPPQESVLISKLFSQAQILEKKYLENGDFFAVATLPEQLLFEYQKYIVI